jgi:ribose transport system substrate-binding protein
LAAPADEYKKVSKLAVWVIAIGFLFVIGGDFASFLFKSGGAAANRCVIALIPMGTTDEYWKAIHAGGEKAAQELNANIIWQGPMRRGDRSAQIEVVENMIVREVDGIVMAPADNMAMRGPVENAYRSNIPVVIIDSDLRSNRQISFIATNNYMGGFMGGEYLAKLVGNKGKVALLRNIEGHSSTEHREQGFLDAIKKHPDIQVVSSNQYAGPTSESAYKASENLLAAFKTPDGALTIDGVFCSCECSTFGMLRALQDASAAGKTRFVGFDSSDKLAEAMERHELDALVVQDPVRIGYLGVKTVINYIRGGKIDKQVDVPATLATTTNMHEREIAGLLHPDVTSWMKQGQQK